MFHSDSAGIRWGQVKWSSLSVSRSQKMSSDVLLRVVSNPFDDADSFLDPILGLSRAELVPLVSCFGWNCLFIRVNTLSALRYSVIDPAN